MYLGLALVGSLAPSAVTAAQTAIQQQGATWTITSLGPQSQADIDLWNRADGQLGVIGSDFRGLQQIGSAAFERASNSRVIPDWLNFWYPQHSPRDPPGVHYKRTLAGVILDRITRVYEGKEVALSKPPKIVNYTEDDAYTDHDLNIDIAPFASYDYLIREAHAPEESRKEKIRDAYKGEDDPCVFPFIRVQAEIDSSDVAKNKLLSALSAKIGKPIGVYGPWIWDEGHCYQPEIHPAEQIWWLDSGFVNFPEFTGTARQYQLNVIADSSRRFIWRHQMDDGTKMRPWAAPPITGIFAVAFEVPLNPTGPKQNGKVYRATTHDFFNVEVLTDNSKAFNLIYRGVPLVSFKPDSPVYKVSYENIGIKPGTSNIVRGFLVLEITVGSVRQRSSDENVFAGRVPPGSDPDKVDEMFEEYAFEKIAGHKMFRLVEMPLRTDPGAGAIADGGESGALAGPLPPAIIDYVLTSGDSPSPN